MLIVGVFVAISLFGVFALRRRRSTVTLYACAIAATVPLWFTTSNAAIVPPVPLGTAAQYSVLGASTVTNTGPSVLNGSVGLFPGTSVTGFPPGIVVPPATMNVTNAAAQQAQADLTTAYVNAAGRPLDGTTGAELANTILPGGVYAGPSKGALLLSGPLVLDGAGDPSSVWIFQTDSTLTTATGSTVSMINGGLECNVFWQIGSSATLATGSVFRGNILALASITVNTGVVVHGRALASTAAVTLSNDVFVNPTCTVESTTTSSPPADSTSTLVGEVTTTSQAGEVTTTSQAAEVTTTSQPGVITSTSQVGEQTTTSQAGAVTTTSQVAGETTTSGLEQTTTTIPPLAAATTQTGPSSTAGSGLEITTSSVPGVGGPGTSVPRVDLPYTGSSVALPLVLAAVATAIGLASLRILPDPVPRSRSD